MDLQKSQKRTAQPKLLRVTVYTDGSCRPNPGHGAWAAVLRYGEHERTLVGTGENTTSNQMELQAAISALQALRKRCVVHLYVDSQYLQRGITEWLPRWRSAGWHTRGGNPVKNADLWQILDQLTHAHEVRWHWLKGHSGDPGNELANRLAREALDAAAQATMPPVRDEESD